MQCTTRQIAHHGGTVASRSSALPAPSAATAMMALPPPLFISHSLQVMQPSSKFTEWAQRAPGMLPASAANLRPGINIAEDCLWLNVFTPQVPTNALDNAT